MNTTNRGKVKVMKAWIAAFSLFFRLTHWQWHFLQREQYGDLSKRHLMPYLQFVEERCQCDGSDKAHLLSQEACSSKKEGIDQLVITCLCICVCFECHVMSWQVMQWVKCHILKYTHHTQHIPNKQEYNVNTVAALLSLVQTREERLSADLSQFY